MGMYYFQYREAITSDRRALKSSLPELDDEKLIHLKHRLYSQTIANLDPDDTRELYKILGAIEAEERSRLKR